MLLKYAKHDILACVLHCICNKCFLLFSAANIFIARYVEKNTQKRLYVKLYSFIVDFKLSPWFEYCICSFGYFPGVNMWYAYHILTSGKWPKEHMQYTHSFFIPCIEFHVGHMQTRLLNLPAPHKKMRIAALEGRTFLWYFFLRSARAE